jgi:hypothetical protein
MCRLSAPTRRLMILFIADLPEGEPAWGPDRKYYIMDTNIWVDVTQGKIACNDLSGKAGAVVVVAPFMIFELMRATVRGGEKYFLGDRKMFECMERFDILELTQPFVYKTLWNISDARTSKVDPETYKTLLHMMVGSTSFMDFIIKTKRPDSVWNRVSNWDSIHEKVLDKEIGALGKIADQGSLKSLGMYMAGMYQVGGLLPDPDKFERTFSAALEYLRSSARKLRKGANLAKNDRGLYVDFQIFFYLADPSAVIVSKEDFSGEIAKSPQRSRIISLAQYRNL